MKLTPNKFYTYTGLSPCPICSCKIAKVNAIFDNQETCITGVGVHEEGSVLEELKAYCYKCDHLFEFWINGVIVPATIRRFRKENPELKPIEISIPELTPDEFHTYTSCVPCQKCGCKLAKVNAVIGLNHFCHVGADNFAYLSDLEGLEAYCYKCNYQPKYWVNDPFPSIR